MNHQAGFQRQLKNENGFTLIEVMIACGILAGLMTGVAGYMYQQSRQRANLLEHASVSQMSRSLQSSSNSLSALSSTQDFQFEILTANQSQTQSDFQSGIPVAPTPAPLPSGTPLDVVAAPSPAVIAAAGTNATPTPSDPTPSPSPSATATPSPTVVVSYGGCNPSGAPFGGGTGTNSDPYLVCSRTHIVSLGNSKPAHSTWYFSQTTDIDLGGSASPMEPIQLFGNNGNTTSLVYNGNNHKIINLYISKPDMTDVGLIKTIQSDATHSIKNLTLQGDVRGKENVGLLLGSYSNINPANQCAGGCVAGSVIENITLSGSVAGQYQVGALLGFVDHLTIKSITSTAAVKGENYVIPAAGSPVTSTAVTSGPTGASGFIGGIVGNIKNSWLYDSVSFSSVIGANGVGGIAGGMNSSSLNNDGHYGNVTCANSSCGGIIGVSYIGQVNGCASQGDIINTASDSADSMAGGIIGYSGNTLMTDSRFFGTLTAKNFLGGALGRANGGFSIRVLAVTTAFNVDTIAASYIPNYRTYAAGSPQGVTNGYYYSGFTGPATSNYGLALTLDQIKQTSNFSGFDFTNKWTLPSSGSAFSTSPGKFQSPVLKWECQRGYLSCD